MLSFTSEAMTGLTWGCVVHGRFDVEIYELKVVALASLCRPKHVCFTRPSEQRNLAEKYDLSNNRSWRHRGQTTIKFPQVVFNITTLLPSISSVTLHDAFTCYPTPQEGVFTRAFFSQEHRLLCGPACPIDIVGFLSLYQNPSDRPRRVTHAKGWEFIDGALPSEDRRQAVAAELSDGDPRQVELLYEAMARMTWSTRRAAAPCVCCGRK
ncbi:hypothetical protein Q8F55_009098 [Vanrija albida]|uniref:SUN domain-containing protein n=1 Tax=Vanrija albida TaxID=181172 RepID=A0ABR3PSY4_9TREE